MLHVMIEGEKGDYVIFEGLDGGAEGSSCSLISRRSSWDDVGDP